ncbi:MULTISPECIES: ATP-binding protein [unclassified Paracoccus (in: a-proteobacteria)]|uniref:ATP-binding protein n=1 Tax=unclassified Paracoccus (in: a-proteobacteria) TaxID=2688777 RepID=UPI0012B3BB04|nr:MULTISPECIES: ATP-binding protein [unclassified Paracoccus (in: a-proteobacteria)]UXU76507.1 ATP-binding protein [Paracoccus sp. SMMA_5]UXU82426.1 ATP-binding protein [Paracoccus sp. SMMA_5_TC]
MNLRESLGRISLTAAPTAEATPQDVWPWVEAAAVLVHFDPLTLRSRSGFLSPLSPEIPQLIDLSQPSLAARQLRRLRDDTRRQALAGLGNAAAMQAQLALNPQPDHPTQQALAALIAGPSATEPLLRSQDPGQLAALAEALAWLQGILPDLPDPQQVAQQAARARLLAPLRKLVGSHFAGRADVLAQIADHLRLAPPGAVLMVQGPGGVGKSTVLAKFILDAVEHDPNPPTVLLLNLDDPQLVIDDPFTLLLEAGRQLRIQHPELNPELDGMRDHIASLRLRSRSTETMESVTGGAVDWHEVSRIARAAMAIIPGNQPVLLVIDTFEEAQTTGPSAVSRLMQLVDSLKSGNPRLRVIIAGRAQEDGLPAEKVTLRALDPIAARAVLEKSAGLGPLPQAVADQVYAIARGNPLATYLAGRVLATEGRDAFADSARMAQLIGQIRTEKVQAQLYGRVLGHIHDEQVRRLAYPGLVLRRITPDILLAVLAEPCGVTIADSDAAQDLFTRFGHEVALVQPEPGTGALRYREDVRRLVLTDLRRDQPQLAADIDRAAVRYYRDRPGALARAEELYHLLALDSPAEELDPRWDEAAAPLLSGALDELPPRAQIWLANRLRIDLRPEWQDLADQQSWETSAEQTARALMRDKLPQEALSVLNQRQQRLPASPLFLTEAEALVMLGQPETALQILRQGIASAETAGDRLTQVALLLVETLIHETRRALLRAGQAARRAVDLAQLTENTPARLRSLMALLRLHRHRRGLPGPAPETLVAEAERLLRNDGVMAQLSATPGLMRELAAELGMRDPQVLAAALRGSGAGIALPPALRGASAASIVSDRRARPLLGDMLLPDEPFANGLALVNDAPDRQHRFARVALVCDLMAAEIDHSRGGLPARAMRARPTPWRQSPLAPDQTAWGDLVQSAF